MFKKILIRYSILGLPFIFGMLFYINGSINIISSLLLSVGGYIFIKNIFDYRKIKRNIYYIKKKSSNLDSDIKKDINLNKSNILIVKSNKDDKIKFSKDDCLYVYKANRDEGLVNECNIVDEKQYKSYENIPGIKRVRCYRKVRRKY